jgi:hypothetical protein
MNWAASAIKKGRLNTWYRVFAPKHNIEDDLFKIAQELQELKAEPDAGRLYNDYVLRLIWRFLHRRYAYGPASRIAKIIRQRREGFWWGLWRWKDYAQIRLLIGICAGFFLVLSSGDISAFLRNIDGTSIQTAHWIVAIGLTVAFSAWEVEKQVGRQSFSLLLRRTLLLAGIGLFFGVCGATLEFWIGRQIRGYEHPWAVALSTGLLAVVLGHIFQLFGQDQPLGDPV